MLASPDHRQDALHAALTSVARAIADSLDVKQVWSRVGDACRTVVAFDGMGVARLAPDGQVHLLLSMGTLEAPDLREVSFPRAEFSEALWPHADHDFVLIADARRELDEVLAQFGLMLRTLVRVRGDKRSRPAANCAQESLAAARHGS